MASTTLSHKRQETHLLILMLLKSLIEPKERKIQLFTEKNPRSNLSFDNHFFIPDFFGMLWKVKEGSHLILMPIPKGRVSQGLQGAPPTKFNYLALNQDGLPFFF